VLGAGCWTLDVRASRQRFRPPAAPATAATLARSQCPQCPQRRQRPLCPQCSQRPRPRRLGPQLQSRARAEQLRLRGESLSVPQWHRHCAVRCEARRGEVSRGESR
jgi:hypothetical protein